MKKKKHKFIPVLYEMYHYITGRIHRSHTLAMTASLVLLVALGSINAASAITIEAVSPPETIRQSPPDTNDDLRMAEPEAGFEEYNRYLYENAILPDTASINSATYLLRFEINRQGKPVNLEIIEGSSDEYRSAARELVINGPAWKHAETNGQYYNEPVILSVVFRKRSN